MLLSAAIFGFFALGSVTAGPSSESFDSTIITAAAGVLLLGALDRPCSPRRRRRCYRRRRRFRHLLCVTDLHEHNCVGEAALVDARPLRLLEDVIPVATADITSGSQI